MGVQTTTVRIDDAVYRRLVRRAKAEDRSVNQVMTRAIEQYLEGADDTETFLAHGRRIAHRYAETIRRLGE